MDPQPFIYDSFPPANDHSLSELYANNMEFTPVWTESEHHLVPNHSRDSSAGSSVSSPITSVFSTRTHSRWPISTSSLPNSPDSPTSMVKPALDDLAEEPAEPTDEDELPKQPSALDMLCLCDTIFCEHRQFSSNPAISNPPSVTSNEYNFEEYDFASNLPTGRRSSGDSASDKLSSRVSRRMPSFSRRWGSRKASKSIPAPCVRSAPPSRSSSFRRFSRKQPLATHPEALWSDPLSGVQLSRQLDSLNALQIPMCQGMPIVPHEEESPPLNEGSPDQQQRSPTPLLPPLDGDLTNSGDELISPPDSARGLDSARTGSIFSSPISSPTSPSIWSPSLSAKASFASMRTGFSRHTAYTSADIPPLNISGEIDKWAVKLGHADFHISPEPYLPQIADGESCKRLLNDWEAARSDYLRQVARISEHYGPTSQVHKLAAEKWSEIDSTWRSNFEFINAELEAAGAGSDLKALPETRTHTTLPTLSDPENPEKFPTIDEADIVGPMVQHARVAPISPKKPILLKLLTDAASMLRKS